MSGERRTYEDYEEMGRYLEAAQFAVARAQRKSFGMFGGLDPLTEDTVTMETRSTPTSYDETILEAVLLLEKLRSGLAADFHAEIDESEVPPGKPRTPPPFGRARRGDVVRTGLKQALEALDSEAGAECVGTSGFTRREDILTTTSPGKAKLVKGA